MLLLLFFLPVCTGYTMTSYAMAPGFQWQLTYADRLSERARIVPGSHLTDTPSPAALTAVVSNMGLVSNSPCATACPFNVTFQMGPAAPRSITGDSVSWNIYTGGLGIDLTGVFIDGNIVGLEPTGVLDETIVLTWNSAYAPVAITLAGKAYPDRYNSVYVIAPLVLVNLPGSSANLSMWIYLPLAIAILLACISLFVLIKFILSCKEKSQ